MAHYSFMVGKVTNLSYAQWYYIIFPSLAPTSTFELRHARMAAAAHASCSPTKRDAKAASASSPFLASPRGGGDGGKDGVLRSSHLLHQRYPLPVRVRAPRARGPPVPIGPGLLPDSARRPRLPPLRRARARPYRLLVPSIYVASRWDASCLLKFVILLDFTRLTCAVKMGFGLSAPG
ncbi:hypothetical protein ACQJBY_054670 [Aegilops geniculata]